MKKVVASVLVLAACLSFSSAFLSVDMRWIKSIRQKYTKGQPNLVKGNQKVHETVHAGYRLPMDVTLQTLVDDKVVTLPISDIFAGKKVAIVGVPGCFTKTCQKHLKGFKKHHSSLLKLVDLVVCISVNDAYVMDACKNFLEYDDILMLADGNAQFAKKTGLAMDTGSFGGIRLNRLSMIVDDGVIVKMNIEKDGAYTGITSAESLLSSALMVNE
eukprot:gene1431-2753_t